MSIVWCIIKYKHAWLVAVWAEMKEDDDIEDGLWNEWIKNYRKVSEKVKSDLL